MSESNRVRIAYREAGSVEPWQIIRRTGDALTAGTETVRSDEIRSDRQRSGQKATTITAGGTLDFEMSSGSFDSFLAAALCTDWTTDVLTVGTTTKRFDVIKSYLADDEHIVFKDMEVGQLSLTAESGQKITGQITFAGREVDDDYDITGDTFTEATTGLIFDSSNNLNGVTVDGMPLSGTVFKALGLTINNNHQTDQAVGEKFQNHFKGSCDITTTSTIRMASAALDLWRSSTLGNVPVALAFNMADGNGYSYAFELGEVYLSTEPPSGALDAILDLSADGTAAVDSTGEMITITRVTV
ncbi:hypothetical protein ELY33_17195 [Vreelandella andesensis]|uniref:Major tail protein n=1 Tax=Vreelandella andesensis TaxID=447567 RepID=A0A3S0WEQ3_9GAMM|nr:phage tail tube protein [Halomonas andesensis]RUR26844.1 hypothetical protein ELY33_17195 [Halomonas andesensis]